MRYISTYETSNRITEISSTTYCCGSVESFKPQALVTQPMFALSSSTALLTERNYIGLACHIGFDFCSVIHGI